jgi:hypothetical protein
MSLARLFVLVVGLAVVPPLTTGGCVTKRMWELRERLAAGPGPSASPAAEAPRPRRIEEAVRAGDGAYHLRLDCGVAWHHVRVQQRSTPSTTDEDTPWPRPGLPEPVVTLIEDQVLPSGVPLATEAEDELIELNPRFSPDDDTVDGGPLLRVTLDGDAVLLVHPDGARELLANFSPDRRPWPKVGEPPRSRQVAVAALCALATPFTLALDVVMIGLGALWGPIYLLRDHL